MGQERLSVLLRNNLASNVTGAVQYAEAVEKRDALGAMGAVMWMINNINSIELGE